MAKKQLVTEVLAIIATAAACFLPTGAFAAETSMDTQILKEQIEENKKTINLLSEKLQALETKVGQERQENAGASAGSGAFSFLDKVTWLHGFADVNFGVGSSRKDKDDRLRGFSLGLFDFYLTPQLGDKVKTLAEIIFQIEKDGEVDVMLQRLQIGYTFGDYATIWAGRYHAPLGYWNSAFPHGGKQLQTSILRPKFLNFDDGGIVPTMLNGLLGSGRAAVGDGTLTYDAYVSNGVKIKDVDNGGGMGGGMGAILDSNDVKDDNNNFSAGVNLGYEAGGALDGLKIGTHWYGGRVDGYDDTEARVDSSRVNILGGYAYYNAHDWEIFGEYFHFLNRNKTGEKGTYSSNAAFVQVGHTFAKFTPYARYEVADLDQMDNYFAQQKNGTSYTREAAGIRYELTPNAALKVEGNHTRTSDREKENYNELRFQAAIRF